MRSVSRENAGYSKRQVQKHLGYIGAIFKVAKVYNPGTDLDKPRVKRGKVTFFYHSEVERIREHLGEQDSARVLVMSRIGLRRGEIVALRWMDVDFSGEQVHVRKNYVEGEEKDPKDHEVRSVPLQEDALQALAALSLRERFTELRPCVPALGRMPPGSGRTVQALPQGEASDRIGSGDLGAPAPHVRDVRFATRQA